MDAVASGAAMSASISEVTAEVYVMSEVLPCVRKICSSLGKKKKQGFNSCSLQKVISVSESEQQKKNLPVESWAALLVPGNLYRRFLCLHPKPLSGSFSITIGSSLTSVK
ncbi:hypothetical protein HPP92_015966 [Vanilla planifolia]|uniref:Uncharacterized protein n=1 Tax=Vanilla planifolia TaxID=51239 RepID=A0A835QK62_VANPL|nr:hypothetical protein HPP92_015966 [Vanilla planifolia]